MNAEKIEMFFLILLNYINFQEKNQIVLDSGQVYFLLQVYIYFFFKKSIMIIIKKSLFLIFSPKIKEEEDQFLHNLTQSFLGFSLLFYFIFMLFITKHQRDPIINNIFKIYFQIKV